MKIAFYSTKPYDRIYFEPKSQEYDMQLHFYETGCNEETIPLAKGHDAICIFVNDHLNENMIRQLKEMGIKAIRQLLQRVRRYVLLRSKSLHPYRIQSW